MGRTHSPAFEVPTEHRTGFLWTDVTRWDTRAEMANHDGALNFSIPTATNMNPYYKITTLSNDGQQHQIGHLMKGMAGQGWHLTLEIL